jgi:hypothetical protein
MLVAVRQFGDDLIGSGGDRGGFDLTAATRLSIKGLVK